MKTKTLNTLINYLLYCAGLVVTVSGFILAWKLPHGPGGSGSVLLGLSRHQWSDLHLCAGCVAAGIVLLHLALHWKWIWRVAADRIPGRVWVGAGLPPAVCAMLLFIPLG